ncbi:MAG: hypothetical protein AVDCRST_MAG66-2714 [uncultured Pseudonocardia sp.]|uniref:Uncharacterized protein n=1 Tax=uncultured Pseudonocardia sp. TaxID=211455 RepID=A0A6J4PTH7_9PSEU|nr:MAG: hypothetical protein AVDCRST_MAG66-2714 [uncultured Pseudonocardia sp.]
MGDAERQHGRERERSGEHEQRPGHERGARVGEGDQRRGQAGEGGREAVVDRPVRQPGQQTCGDQHQCGRLGHGGGQRGEGQTGDRGAPDEEARPPRPGVEHARAPRDGVDADSHERSIGAARRHRATIRSQWVNQPVQTLFNAPWSSAGRTLSLHPRSAASGPLTAGHGSASCCRRPTWGCVTNRLGGTE